MKIAIGTTSELKIRALQDALKRFGVQAEVVPIKTDSGVSNQPFGYEEIIRGAKNRVRQCQKEMSSDIAITMAIESGLVEIQEDYYDCACVFALSKEGDESISFCSGFPVPKWVINEIREKNTEYGNVTQKISNDPEKDPMKYFSGGVLRREEILSQAVLIALVKLFNKNKFEKAS